MIDNWCIRTGIKSERYNLISSESENAKSTNEFNVKRIRTFGRALFKIVRRRLFSDFVSFIESAVATSSSSSSSGKSELTNVAAAEIYCFCRLRIYLFICLFSPIETTARQTFWARGPDKPSVI